MLAVLLDRLQATMQAFLEGIPAALKATARQGVCTDRWDSYAGAVAAARPTAQLVVDRFHVAVHYRKAVDELRQTEYRRTKPCPPPDCVPCRAGNGRP